MNKLLESQPDGNMQQPAAAHQNLLLPGHAIDELAELFVGLSELSATYYWELDSDFRVHPSLTPLLKRQDEALYWYLGQINGLLAWDARVVEGPIELRERLKALLMGRQKISNFEFRRRDGSGELRHMRASGNPVFDSLGAFCGYRGFSRDLTRRNRLSQLLDLEHAVTHLLATSRSTADALTNVIHLICASSDWSYGQYFRVDSATGALQLGEHWLAPGSVLEPITAESLGVQLRPGMGVAGKVWESGEPLWVSDASDSAIPANPALTRAMNLRGTFAFAVKADERILGVLLFTGERLREPDGRLIAAAKVIGAQLGQYLRRVTVEEALRESERFANGTLNALEDQIGVIDEHGEILAVNQAWRYFGAANGQSPGRGAEGENYYSVCAEATGADAAIARECAESIRRIAAGQQDFCSIEHPCHSPDEHRWFRLRATRFNGDGPTRVALTYQNITEVRRATELERLRAMQQELLTDFGRQALAGPDLERLFEALATTAAQGLGARFSKVIRLSSDQQSVTLEAGGGWEDGWVGKRTQFPADELRNRYLVATRQPLIIADHRQDQRFEPSRILEAHQIRSSVEVPILSDSTAYGILGVYAREPNRFDDDSAAFLNGLASTMGIAITRQQSADRLKYLAHFDPLTGLANRVLFREQLDLAVAAAEADGTAVAVLIADADRFARVNDIFGHQCGDQLLRLVGRRLASDLAPGDTLARLPGDEFGVVLTQIQDAAAAKTMAAKLMESMASPFEVEGERIFVSLSCGISTYPGDSGPSSSTMLKHADLAMRRVKETGRKGFQVYQSAMGDRERDRLRLESELNGALERDEFFLRYEPRLNLRTGELCGFEALIRWRHPERSIVSPAEFVPVLEEMGLILPVGEWVIAEVCRQLKSWNDDQLQPVPIAINLSARQFVNPGLERMIAECAKTAGIEPNLIELEITESMLMSPEAAMVTLDALDNMGFRILIDDFGTGYSSLSYISRFPISALKIDRSFVSKLGTDPRLGEIVTTMIHLARSLKLRIVAEGVETESQLAFLHANGCDEAQGYYFSKPIDGEDCTRLLVSGRRLWTAPSQLATMTTH